MLKRLIVAIAVVIFALAVPIAASAQSLPCGDRTYNVDPGKSGAGFKGTASDGCHTYNWTNTAGQGPGSGELTFRTSHVMQGWEQGSTLPSMAGGAANYCAYQAAHEANMIFVNHFKVPDGTEVTVRYSCQ